MRDAPRLSIESTESTKKPGLKKTHHAFHPPPLAPWGCAAGMVAWRAQAVPGRPRPYQTATQRVPPSRSVPWSPRLATRDSPVGLSRWPGGALAISTMGGSIMAHGWSWLTSSGIERAPQPVRRREQPEDSARSPTWPRRLRQKGGCFGLLPLPCRPPVP